MVVRPSAYPWTTAARLEWVGWCHRAELPCGASSDNHPHVSRHLQTASPAQQKKWIAARSGVDAADFSICPCLNRSEQLGGTYPERVDLVRPRPPGGSTAKVWRACGGSPPRQVPEFACLWRCGAWFAIGGPCRLEWRLADTGIIQRLNRKVSANNERLSTNEMGCGSAPRSGPYHSDQSLAKITTSTGTDCGTVSSDARAALAAFELHARMLLLWLN